MKNQETKILVIFLMIFIFASVGLYYYYNQEVAELTYNGYAIKKLTESNYQITVHLPNDPNPNYIYIRNDPRDVEHLETPTQQELFDVLLSNKEQVFFTMDPKLSSKAVVASLEISKFIANQYFYNIPTHGALTEKHGSELPFITCVNATSTDGVILLRLGEETKAYTEETCLIIEGKTEDNLIDVADAIAFKLLGIIK